MLGAGCGRLRLTSRFGVAGYLILDSGYLMLDRTIGYIELFFGHRLTVNGVQLRVVLLFNVQLFGFVLLVYCCFCYGLAS